ncbi:peptide/nickel transport system permease protein/oligopeptide transport system permease protein [Thermosporothrix hazakensis]|jgi:ABC-type dipeptide/oligopeptide/nickel transport system permease subunit|uniref:Peptide/nickel transport system permease protein/oligopeptide transport system permease protein n=2 Tax=Thermosporothrix TaxID=768650 RepID=A0A326UL34_THEHA|nr:ABC transporter permease [Thermosporothrix hazakensis]PZW33053.1 peptide/nickel transport system permease protein/oligopeptide transport system permease protein [Thermosporothrix hazakensis]BBH91033.1 peptide ABC transporter permease [Thermosporothrix sp. COM3]GCE49085.1 peptide ABC transporter permease [Thermosporothrix hazakensis]
METRDQNPSIEQPEARPPEVTENQVQAVIEGKVQKSPTPFQQSLRRLMRDRRALVSMCVIAFLVLISLIGPPIYQHIGGTIETADAQKIGPTQYHSHSFQNLDHLDEGPNGLNWLGTDRVGRDMLARLMQGILVSIVVAVLVEIIDILLGVVIGVLAGYYGGWVDTLLARFTDLMFAFPGLLFVILLTGIFGPQVDVMFANTPLLSGGNARLLLVVLALSITSWPLMARYVRGQTMQLKQQQFIEAAKAAGTTDLKIITKHIVPNLFSIVIIAATLNISNTIINEAGISLLGLGVQDPGSSIGLMISAAQTLLAIHPWEALLPTGMLAVIVLAFSFLGDGLRDAFDPRSKD